MLQIEIFEDRGERASSFVVVFQFANDIRAGKKVCYTLSPSSSGQGRHPFKVDIAGSNPAGGTI